MKTLRPLFLSLLTVAILASVLYAGPRYPVKMVAIDQQPQQSVPYVSPRGYHRHVTYSGEVIEHHNSNAGSFWAHRDIPWPANKYYGPLPPMKRR